MKVKVSVPTEPVCNIKFEVEEAKALLQYLTGDLSVKTDINIEPFIKELVEQLHKQLHIPIEGPLFKTDGEIIDAEVNETENRQLLTRDNFPF